MIQIPNKEKKEWRELLTGTHTVTLSTVFLQLKVSQIQDQIRDTKISIENGVDELYNNFTELNKSRDLSKDIEAIFGKMVVVKKPAQTPKEPVSSKVKVKSPSKKEEVAVIAEKPNSENNKVAKKKAIIKIEKEAPIVEKEKIVPSQTETLVEKAEKIIKEPKLIPEEVLEKKSEKNTEKPKKPNIDDISTRIKKIKEEAEERIRALKKNSNFLNEDYEFSNADKKPNSKLPKKENTISKTNQTKEDINTTKIDSKGKIINLETQKEAMKKASLERSTKRIKENTKVLKKKEDKDKGWFFKSIFNN